jgi:HSP20 family molecular chaperone IbpA
MLMPRKNFDLLDDFFDDPFFRRELVPTHINQLMKTDIRENENSYVMDVDLPGFEKENIKIDLENGYLNIHAKMENSKNEDEKGKFIKRERYFGECSRSFYVGEDIKEEEIKASFNNGILTLEVPKKPEEEKEAEKKYIDIE